MAVARTLPPRARMPDDFDSAIGSYLREKLHTLGRPQVDLARVTGLSPASISDWMRGVKEMIPRRMQTMAEGLAVLEGREGDPEYIRDTKERLLRLAGLLERPV